MPRLHAHRAGVTLAEILIVAALLSVLALAAVAVARPRPAHEHARALAHAVGMQRWLAVQEGRAVVIRASSARDIVVASRGAYTCEVGAGVQVLVEERSGVTVRWPAKALAFGSDGRARRCDGGGVGNATIDLLDRNGNRAAVIVAALGRVRWEPR